MNTLNRNIITTADVNNLMAVTTPKTLGTNPPAAAAFHSPLVFDLEIGSGWELKQKDSGVVSTSIGVLATPSTQGSGGVAVPTEDDYLTKLLKYVPLEVLGAYLFTAGVVDSDVTENHNRAVWLGVLLSAFLLITAVYDVRVLNVVRPTQVVVSNIGIAVYVFSVGGWFAKTTWYHAWFAALALPAFALLVAIIRLKPLPNSGRRVLERAPNAL